MLDKNIPICLFDERTSDIVAAMSLSPRKLIARYMPATNGVWGYHLAAALTSDDIEAETTRYVIPEGADIVDYASLPVATFCTGDFDINGNPEFIKAPSLIANDFDLAIALEERDTSDEISQFAKNHQKELVWIRKDKWQNIIQSARMGKSISNPERVEADCRNIESVLYVIASTSPRVIKNQE